MGLLDAGYILTNSNFVYTINILLNVAISEKLCYNQRIMT